MADLIYNDARTHVLVRHTEHGGLWECPVGVLHTMRKLGWEPVEEQPQDDLVGLTDETQVQEPVYDPSEHSADEVSAYLASQVENNPAEVFRVVEAERSSAKPRKSITVPDGYDPIGA